MIRFNGVKVIAVGDAAPVNYLSYQTREYGVAGHCISEVAHLVLIDMRKQNVNIGKQAMREGQDAVYLDAHFMFNGKDVVCRASQTPEQVREAFLQKLQDDHDDYEKSPEGIAAQERYNRDIEERTEMARNCLKGIERQSLRWQRTGVQFQPTAVPGRQLMEDLQTFIGLCDNLPNENWDQFTFMESMKRFNYVQSEHVGKEKHEFVDAAVKRGYIVGQAMNFVDKHGCFHQSLLIALERYLENPDGSLSYEKPTRGERTHT